MKFYYNDKLIRTSQTHVYKFAVLHGDRCLGCSTTREGALKNACALNNAKKDLAIFESVLNGTYVRKSRNHYTAEQIIKRAGGIEAVKKQIDSCKTYIAECVVVELEARA